MWLKKYFILGLVVICGLGLIGCNKKNETVAVPETNEIAENVQITSVKEITKDSTILAVRQLDKLLLVNPETGQYAPIHTLSADEVPLGNQLFEFQVTGDNAYVVWFTVQKGIIALDINKKETKVLDSNNEWFNRNPYLELDEEKPIVYWIGDEGKILNEYNLENGSLNQIPIPYPFGNIFKVSPDNESFLYITGYDKESLSRPRFMFSDRSGKLDSTFASQIELSDRFVVEWTPDNQGILTLFDGQVWFYRYDDPDNPSQFVKLDDAQARDIKRMGNEIFVLDSAGYWHRYDYETKKETARIPTDIARELRKPQFYPWPDQSLLISEISQDEENRFSRLWLSNFRGQKQMVLAQFGEAKVATFSIQLD